MISSQQGGIVCPHHIRVDLSLDHLVLPTAHPLGFLRQQSKLIKSLGIRSFLVENCLGIYHPDGKEHWRIIESQRLLQDNSLSAVLSKSHIKMSNKS